MGLYPNQVPTAAHDELTDGHLARLLQGLANDGVALVGIVAVWHQVIGLLEIACIDLDLVDEANHVDRVLRLELQIVDLLRTNQDVMPFS